MKYFRRLLLIPGLSLVAFVAGCSPDYNWRDARSEGVPMQLLMPCKPERAQREVPIWGPDRPPAQLHMMSCDVGGVTFALAAAQLPGDTFESANEVVPTGLSAWRVATWHSLRQRLEDGATAPVGWEMHPCKVEGAASAAECWNGPGQNHLGQTLQAQVRWAHGKGWLVQAAVYGAQLPPAVADTYFEGLRFD
jgi:hypothetical protein